MAFFKELVKTEHALLRDYAHHDQAAPIIRVSDLSYRYEAGMALDHVSFELPRATTVAVVGPNGAGKSTLIKIIAGLLAPTSGSVTVFGQDPGGHICIAYVPQRNQVDWTFPVTVRDVVMMGRIGKLGLLRNPGKSDQNAVDHALQVVKLAGQEKRQISQLSGGQQQRMFIARALAQEAELMLMDEPLTGLDIGSQEDILSLIASLRAEGVTILVALHDLKMAAERFDSVLLLNHKLVGMGSPAEVFTNTNLNSAYGRTNISSQADLTMVDDSCCGEDGHNHD